MSDPLEAKIEALRSDPNRTWVRYRINNGEWDTAVGSEFLKLWDEPFAGTIDIDCVYLAWTGYGSADDFVTDADLTVLPENGTQS